MSKLKMRLGATLATTALASTLTLGASAPAQAFSWPKPQVPTPQSVRAALPKITLPKVALPQVPVKPVSPPATPKIPVKPAPKLRDREVPVPVILVSFTPKNAQEVQRLRNALKDGKITAQELRSLPRPRLSAKTVSVTPRAAGQELQAKAKQLSQATRMPLSDPQSITPGKSAVFALRLASAASIASPYASAASAAWIIISTTRG